jgi:hypothetical protein
MCVIERQPTAEQVTFRRVGAEVVSCPLLLVSKDPARAGSRSGGVFAFGPKSR